MTKTKTIEMKLINYILNLNIKKVFALSAALLGARFRNDASLLGGLGGGEEGASPDFEVPAGCNMGRRRSRAVLYQLSGHYKPEKVKTKLKLNNVSPFLLCAATSLFVKLPTGICREIHI